MTETITAPAWAQDNIDLSGKTVLVVGGAGGVSLGSRWETPLARPWSSNRQVHSTP